MPAHRRARLPAVSEVLGRVATEQPEQRGVRRAFLGRVQRRAEAQLVVEKKPVEVDDGGDRGPVLVGAGDGPAIGDTVLPSIWAAWSAAWLASGNQSPCHGSGRGRSACRQSLIVIRREGKVCPRAGVVASSSTSTQPATINCSPVTAPRMRQGLAQRAALPPIVPRPVRHIAATDATGVPPGGRREQDRAALPGGLGHRGREPWLTGNSAHGSFEVVHRVEALTSAQGQNRSMDENEATDVTGDSLARVARHVDTAVRHANAAAGSDPLSA